MLQKHSGHFASYEVPSKLVFALMHHKLPVTEFRFVSVHYVPLCSMNGGACRVSVGRPVERRPLGRPRRRWEDNIKMDIKEVVWGMNWTDMAQDRNRWRAL
jgi:hypothetical protein